MSIPTIPTTPAEARNFVACLVELTDGGIHPDDPPAEIIDFRTGEPLFTSAEADAVDAGIVACFRLLPDVYGALLDALHLREAI
jgi:hypothetical protein